MIRRTALLVLASWLAALPVAAADPDWAGPFRKYVNARAYLNEIGGHITLLERTLAPHCIQNLGGMTRNQLRIIAPPTFIPGLPIPQGGQWHEQLQIDRCGETALHNILITAVNGGTPIMTVLLPGSSKADGRLQALAAPAAFAIASARTGGRCTGSARTIINTRFQRYLGRSGDAAPAERLWTEVWTVRLCGETVQVQMDFTPDGKGGVTHRANVARRPKQESAE